MHVCFEIRRFSKAFWWKILWISRNLKFHRLIIIDIDCQNLQRFMNFRPYDNFQVFWKRFRFFSISWTHFLSISWDLQHHRERPLAPLRFYFGDKWEQIGLPQIIRALTNEHVERSRCVLADGSRSEVKNCGPLNVAQRVRTSLLKRSCGPHRDATPCCSSQPWWAPLSRTIKSWMPAKFHLTLG